DYEKVESLRQKLLGDKRTVKIEDLGAGSSTNNSDDRSISAITRNAVKSKKFGQLLFRIAKYYQAKQVLELGTSLGITSSYLSLGNPGAAVITIEGSSSLADEARKNLASLAIRNCTVLTGNFDDLLK